RALIGKTATPVKKEIEDNFPHLPLGCSIILEKKAKQTILKNINTATSLNRTQLIQKIQNFPHQTTLKLNLKNFTSFYEIPLQMIYKRGGWKRLCHEAGKLEAFSAACETEIIRAISNKWLSCNSSSYFRFVLNLAKNDFHVMCSAITPQELQML